MKKILNLMVMVVTVMMSACTSGGAKPEADLWGTWISEGNQGGETFFHSRLSFHEDGRLVLDGQEEDPAQYVVIAPGRIKITRDGEADAFSYEIIEEQLLLSLDGNVQAFRKTNDPVDIAQNEYDSPGIQHTTHASNSTKIITHTATQVTSTSTSIPPTPTITKTATILPPTVTPIIRLENGDVDYQINPKDGMPIILVPAGEFPMGSNGQNADKNESPEHQVYLDAFWIHQYEVTNRQFLEYIEQSGLMTYAEIQGWSWVFGNGSKKVDGAFWASPAGNGTHIEDRLDHPVVHTGYLDAVNYCNWAGGRLPTEAEWEKAARGPDSRAFPWGGDPIKESKANFCDVQCSMEWSNEFFDDGYEITAPVGSYPEGSSIYGVMDMAGNVWEWVADYYDGNYYEDSPLDNPTGPEYGEIYVIRGGSWVSEQQYLSCTTRYWSEPDETSNDHGFRCVFDDVPTE
ncbi:MAG: formylglycine-generating enzyme family protein [Brevefilum sp.]|nr:formylglycine-generating enzyme family protein [Brevefilum sp.]